MPRAKKSLLQPHQVAAVLLCLATIYLGYLYSDKAKPSYFSNKRNVLNVYFVKLGWLWTTVVFSVYQLFVRRTQWKRGILRYLLVTFYWFLFTQWFFGPSFVDRVFVATGGSCDSLNNGMTVFQQQTCRQMGGQWKGGHDVSGHCVLLIHACLFLWEEISDMVWYRRRQWHWSVLAPLTLIALWLWMLLITAVYFHKRHELLSGAVAGMLGWAPLYLGLFPSFTAIGLP